MSREPSIFTDRYTEPAPRPVRRRAGTVVVIFFAAITGWAVMKHWSTGGLADSEIREGVADLRMGLAGDEAKFEEARNHFVDAASVTVVDPYPGFLIRTSQRLSSPQEGGDLHDRVAAAIAAGDFERARTLTTEFGEPGSRPRIYWEQLIDDLQAPAARPTEE